MAWFKLGFVVLFGAIAWELSGDPRITAVVVFVVGVLMVLAKGGPLSGSRGPEPLDYDGGD